MSKKSEDEALGFLGFIIIAVAAVVWFIVHVVLPAVLIAGGISVCIGVLFAMYTSASVFCKAVSANRNPYASYSDPHPHSHGVRRGYFFGPGLHQLSCIWSDSFYRMDKEADSIVRFLKDRLLHGGMLTFLFHDLWIFVFVCAAYAFLYIFGFAFTFAFCAVLSLLLGAGWLLFFAGYMLLRLSDNTDLLLNAIDNPCPNCKRRRVPLFVCPSPGCSTPHNLQPGPYGIFHTKCSCGELLPTTVFNGRNELVAVCPLCSSPVEGYAQHFGIQVVGNTSAGKTTYLASFFHEYLRQMPSHIKYTCKPEKNFQTLSGAYNSGNKISSTTELNAGMYSIKHEFPMHAPYQLSMYDIAGEAFQNITSAGYQQQQFEYVKGIMLMVDPDASPSETHAAIAAFCSEHKKLKNLTASQMIKIPAAVVITKSDKFSAELPGSLQDEERCRSFLEAHGFTSVVNLIAANFTDTHFFAATAIGHELDGRAYSPSGVVEPVMWLLGEGKSVLPRIIASGVNAFDKVKFAVRKVIPFLVPVLVLWLLFWGISSVSWGKIMPAAKQPSDYATLVSSAEVQRAPAKQPESPAAPPKKTPPQAPAKTTATVQTTRQNPGSREVEKDVPKPKLKLSTLGTKVNVRTRPDINAASLAVLDEGVPVEAGEHRQKSDGVWYKVTLPGGAEGWIRSDLLRQRIGDKGEHGGVFMRVTGDELNLREGPGTKYASIGKLYVGHLVEVIGQSKAWRKVCTQTGKVGWVHSKYLGQRRRY